jgi:hypothetical protein
MYLMGMDLDFRMLLAAGNLQLAGRCQDFILLPEFWIATGIWLLATGLTVQGFYTAFQN